MKIRLIVVLLLISIVTEKSKAQVGINTSEPKATLDVVIPKNELLKPEGIIPPRISLQGLVIRDALYGLDQKGSIVYVNDISGTTTQKTINIKKVGYYFFDGDKWDILSDGNPWNKIGTDITASSNTDDVYIQAKTVVNGTNIGTTTAAGNQAALTVSQGDASINGLTIGRGAGNIESNVTFGKSALEANTSGYNNVSLGLNSLKTTTAGYNNVSVGAFSLQKATTANSNTAIGFQTLLNTTSGNNNVAIGNNSGVSLSTGYSNVLIGSGTNTTSPTAIQQLNIANTLYGTGIGTGTSKVGIGTPSPATKLDIQGDLTIRVANVANLRDKFHSTVVRDNATGLIGVMPKYYYYTTVEAGASFSIPTLDMPTMPAYLTITSANACARHMTSVFNVIIAANRTGFEPMPISLVHINSSARQIVGIANKISPFKYTVKFPNVTTCVDGQGDQFDFTIDSSIGGDIKITNDGTASREYVIQIIPIL